MSDKRKSALAYKEPVVTPQTRSVYESAFLSTTQKSKLNPLESLAFAASVLAAEHDSGPVRSSPVAHPLPVNSRPSVSTGVTGISSMGLGASKQKHAASERPPVEAKRQAVYRYAGAPTPPAPTSFNFVSVETAPFPPQNNRIPSSAPVNDNMAVQTENLSSSIRSTAFLVDTRSLPVDPSNSHTALVKQAYPPMEFVKQAYPPMNFVKQAYPPVAPPETVESVVAEWNSGENTTNTGKLKKSPKKRPKRIRKVYKPTDIAHVTENDKDVLSQRGGRGNGNHGNILYLEARDRLRPEYLKATAAQKHDIANELVKSVHDWGGRFLAQDVKGWYEVHEKAALTKVKQALREGRPDQAADKKEPETAVPL
jgi:hypothetical protein